MKVELSFSADIDSMVLITAEKSARTKKLKITLSKNNSFILKIFLLKNINE